MDANRNDSISSEDSEKSDPQQRKGLKRKRPEQDGSCNKDSKNGPHPRKRWDANEEKFPFLAFEVEQKEIESKAQSVELLLVFLFVFSSFC